MNPRHVLVLAEWHDHLIRYGIGRYATEQGWRLTVSDGTEWNASWSGDGVLALLGRNTGLARRLRRLPVPCVWLGTYRSGEHVPCVQVDPFAIGCLAAEHLLARGYQRAICYASAPTPSDALVRAGFTKRLMKDLGCEVRRVEWTGAGSRGRGPAGGRVWSKWLAREALSWEKPVAVFCFNDVDAARVENVCLDTGLRVPEEVAILGVGNDTLVCDHARVPLSSVRENRVKVGYEGAALLDRLMRAETVPDTPVRVPPRGIEMRASTDAFGCADPLVRAVLAFYRENLQRCVGVEEAARQVGLGCRQIESRFARALGISAHAALVRLRLFEAARLLAQTELAIKAIAALTGFCHAQHLSNAFRRTEGCSPLVYRKRQRRQAGVV